MLLSYLRFVLLLLPLLLVAGTARGQVYSLLDQPAARGIGEGEQALLDEAAAYLDSLQATGEILARPELTAYLNEVADRLLPHDRATLPRQVYLLDDLTPNASALPDGTVFVTTGLLLRFTSEAQLAFVLGHELAHYVQRHAYRERLVVGDDKRDRIRLVEAQRRTGLSRQLEREADQVGLRLYAAAGYPAAEATEALRRLPAEDQATWIFSMFTSRRERQINESLRSHPRTPDRVADLLALVDTTTFLPQAPADTYREQTRQQNQRSRTALLKQYSFGGSYSYPVRLIDSLLAQMGPEEASSHFAWEMRLTQADLLAKLLSLHPGDAARDFNNDRLRANYRGDSTEEEEKMASLWVMAIKKVEDRDEIVAFLGERLAERAEELRSYPPFAVEADRLIGLRDYAQKNYTGAITNLQTYLDHPEADYQRRYVRRIISTAKQERDAAAAAKTKKKRRG